MSTDAAQSQPQPLARYRLLAPACGLRVSPLALGAMSIGQAWKGDLGSMTKEESFKLLDAYVERGGNFIDTANGYQNGESETWIGEWMAQHKNRDELVIATKYTSGYLASNPSTGIKINFSGNSAKSMHLSLHASLEKLQTTYVDILYVHWWDYCSPIEEVMQGLNTLVKQGKVLYLGISDTPAWIVAKANQYARDHGLAQFVLYQGRHSAIQRDMEREIIPMCRAEGMGIAPWGALGAGNFQRERDWKKKIEGKDGRSSKEPSEDQRKVSAALEKIADELGVDSVTTVALAYTLAKHPYCYPILGGRRVEYLDQNIQALTIKLTREHIKAIEEVKAFDVGEPMSVFGLDGHETGHIASLMQKNGTIDFVANTKPIGMA